jgi:hypothetical protein
MLRPLVYSSCAVVLAVVAGAFIAPAAGASGAAASPSLTGETFAGPPGTTNYQIKSDGNNPFACNPSGDTTFTLIVTGPATGPFPGTFDETATVTIGPQTAGLVGTVTQFDATFTITSPAGTVSGTKHLETVTSPAAGQCAGFNPVPCTPGLTIATESFALDATYDASITTSGGTSTDHGISHVSFQGQQQCSVQAGSLNIGTFGESFSSTASPPRCNADNAGDRGNGKDRGRHEGAGSSRGCRPCDDGNDVADGSDNGQAAAGHSCRPSDDDANGNGGDERR